MAAVVADNLAKVITSVVNNTKGPDQRTGEQPRTQTLQLQQGASITTVSFHNGSQTSSTNLSSTHVSQLSHTTSHPLVSQRPTAAASVISQPSSPALSQASSSCQFSQPSSSQQPHSSAQQPHSSAQQPHSSAQQPHSSSQQPHSSSHHSLISPNAQPMVQQQIRPFKTNGPRYHSQPAFPQNTALTHRVHNRQSQLHASRQSAWTQFKPSQISGSGPPVVRAPGGPSGPRPHVAILRQVRGHNGRTLRIGQLPRFSSNNTTNNTRGFPIHIQSTNGQQTTYIQLDNATYRALTEKRTTQPTTTSDTLSTVQTNRQPSQAGTIRQASTSGTGQYVRPYEMSSGLSPQYNIDSPSDTAFHNTISHHSQYYDGYGSHNGYYDRSSHSFHQDINSQKNTQAAIRAAPVTINWIMQNYEEAEGVSLPRCLMYSHYKQHCRVNKLDPVNAASFGKIIRSLFRNLKTRRLGTRGNSKYHYYGIRIKSDSVLNQYGEEFMLPGRTKKMNCGPTEQPQETYDNHSKFIGIPPKSFPTFPPLEIPGEFALPETLTKTHVTDFAAAYTNHCVGIVYAVGLLNFPEVEGLWQSFWQCIGQTAQTYKLKLKREYKKREDPSYDILKNTEEENVVVTEHPTREIIRELCKCPFICEWVRSVDYAVYQMLINMVMPDVLKPIPGTLTQMIRNFAKNMETVMLHALSGLPAPFLQVKCITANAFAQTLRRYTSLNHLAQAARAVLQNPHQISQMLADLNRVDFNNVQEQASWVCGCPDTVVQELEKSFKGALEQQQGLEGWATWLKNVVHDCLAPHEQKPDFRKHAKKFLLNWSFYCSMVIRDLTLRSAASFGSFHLIRLLYDEYMYYLIEQRVAKFRCTNPVVVMGECITLHQALIKKCEESSKAEFSEQITPLDESSVPADMEEIAEDYNEETDESVDDDDDDTLEQHHLTSLDTGKTIPYFNKESRPYMSAKTKQEMVQVKQEPRDDSAYVFDETDHNPKRPCLSNMAI